MNPPSRARSLSRIVMLSRFVMVALICNAFASAAAHATERPADTAVEPPVSPAVPADDDAVDDVVDAEDKDAHEDASDSDLPDASAVDAAIDLSPYAGKVVYVDFWASWCVPCRAAFPWLNALQAELGDEGLVILGINTGDTPEGAARFLERIPADFILLDDETGSIAAAYGVGGLPVAFLHDREGKPIASHIGFDDSYADERAENLRAYVRRPR